MSRCSLMMHRWYRHTWTIGIQAIFSSMSLFGRCDPLRSMEEEIAIRDCIQLRHRSHLWATLSKGILMPSLLPRGTALEATLVKAIHADYPPIFDTGPLPDNVTALLLAQCDPNVLGAPSFSPLGAAVRRGEERTVEVLLQYSIRQIHSSGKKEKNFH